MENFSKKHVLPTKLLVKPAEAKDKKTEGGLFIPATIQKSPSCLGTVVLVGSKVEDVKVGHNILYSPNAVVKVKPPESDEILDLLGYNDILLFW